MVRLLARFSSVVFALGVLVALVAHASMTSGCTKPESARAEPPLQQLPASSATATAAPATATATATASSMANVAASPADAGAKADAGTKPSGNAVPHFMPATKSGMPFRTPTQQQTPAGEPLKEAPAK